MVVATSSTKASSSRDLGRLHHAHHGVVLAPHHPVVAGGVGQHRGEQRGGGAGHAVVAHQGGQRGRAHEWGVAGQHHDVAVGVDEPVGQGGEPDGQGVAGPELRGSARRTRWPASAGRGRPGSWSPSRPGGPPPRPPCARAARPARRGRGGSWGGRTAGAGAWGATSASVSPRRRRARQQRAASSSMRFSLSPDDGGDSAVHDDLERPRRAAEHALPRPMPVLTSTIDPGSDTYRQNRAAMESALAEVEEQLAVARGGGGQRYVRAPPGPGQAARPRARRAAPRPRLPLPRDRPPGRVGDRLHRGGEPGLGHRRGERGRVPRIGQRPHGAGRGHQPLHHAQVVAPGRHRPREPAARRSAWSSRAGPTSPPSPRSSSPAAAAFAT